MAPADERRKRSLTEADIEKIKGIACVCPNGMTQNDVFRLREMLDTWDRARIAVGGYVLKTVIALVLCIGVMVAWITNK